MDNRFQENRSTGDVVRLIITGSKGSVESLSRLISSWKVIFEMEKVISNQQCSDRSEERKNI